MNSTRHRGFTLLETLIYGMLLSGMILVSVLFALNISDGNQKASAYQEVQQNARMAMSRIVQEIEAANDLNAGSSVFGTSPGTLSLVHDIAGLNPTVFTVANGALRIQQGSGPVIPLTSDSVQVTDLTFTNLSLTNRTKNILVSMTVQYVNVASSSIYQASTTLEASATIRNQEDLP